MCGLLGIYKWGQPLNESEKLWCRHTLQKLKYRGPDHQSLVELTPSCTFGGARLRMTDPLNQVADLPYIDPHSGDAIVFNGEIYNHLDLRKKVPDAQFQTHSDTETVLMMYQHYGPECVELFEGMFSYAIWNKKENIIDIAVDPSRQKPFFWVHENGTFAFCSELEPLLSLPEIDFEIHDRAVREIVTFRMNIAPDTTWKQIKKAVPGTVMRINSEGEILDFQYYHFPLPDPENEREALYEQARSDTEKSCKETFTTEHNAAVLLSGGVDSSVVASLLKENGYSPLAISIGFEEGEDTRETYNEFQYSEEMASLLGIEHKKILFSPEEYLTWFLKWLDSAEEPFSSLEAVCLYRIFSELQDSGIRLAYTGTGPDEMLDGYRLGILLKESSQGEEKLLENFFDKFSRRGMADFQKLLGSDFTTTKDFVLNKLAHILAPYDSCNLTTIELVQIINSSVHLPEYEHRQMDFLSMRHGIEVRNPLCSKTLMNLWFSVTGENKTCVENEKWLWKKVSEKYVPQSIAWRKKKGFPVPNYVKQHQIFEDLIDELLSPKSFLIQHGFINRAYLEEIRKVSKEDFRRVFFRLILLNKILTRQYAIVRKRHP